MHYQREGLLIFYNILLFLCDTSLSGIREDKQFLYYYEVEKWSDLYVYQIGLVGSYGHGFKPVNLPENICHYGCIVGYSVRGGTSGAINFRWHMVADCDDVITKGVNYQRWLQIKQSKKLSNNDTETKKGKYGYNPSYKFDCIWRCLIHNVNFPPKHA